LLNVPFDHFHESQYFIINFTDEWFKIKLCDRMLFKEARTDPQYLMSLGRLKGFINKTSVIN
jgi:hypothetical protein